MIISKQLKQKIFESFKSLLRMALQTYRIVYGRLTLLSPINRFKVIKFKKMKTLKLNIGCGKVKLAGWVNIDIEPGADLVIDIKKVCHLTTIVLILYIVSMSSNISHMKKAKKF